MPEIKSEDFVRLATLFVPETAQAIAFSPDGTLLAVAAADKVFIFQVPARARTGGSAPSLLVVGTDESA
jgi:hypothetical protein